MIYQVSCLIQYLTMSMSNANTSTDNTIINGVISSVYEGQVYTLYGDLYDIRQAAKQVISSGCKVDIKAVINPPRFKSLMAFYRYIMHKYILNIDEFDNEVKYDNNDDAEEAGDVEEAYDAAIYGVARNTNVNICEFIDYLFDTRYIHEDVSVLMELKYNTSKTTQDIEYAIKRVKESDITITPNVQLVLDRLYITSIVDEVVPNNRYHVAISQIRHDATNMRYESLISICTNDRTISNDQIESIIMKLKDRNLEVNASIMLAFNMDRISWKFAYDMCIDSHVIEDNTSNLDWLFKSNRIPEDMIQTVMDMFPIPEGHYVSSFEFIQNNSRLTPFSNILLEYDHHERVLNRICALEHHDITFEYIERVLEDDGDDAPGLCSIIARNPLTSEYNKMKTFNDEYSKYLLSEPVAILIQRWWRDITMYNPRKKTVYKRLEEEATKMI